MSQHIVQACREMERILPSITINPDKNRLSYGDPEQRDESHWTQASILYAKSSRFSGAYDYSGIVVSPDVASDRMCEKRPDDDVYIQGTHYDCYTPFNFTHIIKHAVTPSDAFRRIFSKPRLYTIECAMACWLIFYKAILNMVPDVAFDMLFPNLSISPYIGHTPLIQYVDGSESAEKAPPIWESQLEIGVAYYIKNWDESRSGGKVGKTGENVIYCGENTFFGFPFGFKKLDEIIVDLNTYRKPGSRISASFNKSYTKLREDKIQQAVSRMVTEPTTTQ